MSPEFPPPVPERPRLEPAELAQFALDRRTIAPQEFTERLLVLRSQIEDLMKWKLDESENAAVQALYEPLPEWRAIAGTPEYKTYPEQMLTADDHELLETVKEMIEDFVINYDTEKDSN